MAFKRFLNIRWILGFLLIFAVFMIIPGGRYLASPLTSSDQGVGQMFFSASDYPSSVDDAPPDSYTGTHVVIRFNDCAIHNTTDCISNTRAQLLADQLDTAWDLFINFGFNAPDPGDGPPLPVEVFSPLVDDALGWSRGSHIEVRTDRVQTSATDVHKGTPHHELFHQVQRTYGDGEPAWVSEGTAKFIEDNVFADGDADAGSQYVARVNIYLDNPNLLGWDDVNDVAAPGGLFDTSYNAAIIWKYLTEHFGSTNDLYFGAEPQYGIDFLVDYWEASETHNGIDAVNAALPGGVNFNGVFKDFLVTNYLTRYNVTPAFTYVDDPGPAYAYQKVHVEYGTEALPFSHNNERVEDWGAIYYVGDPPGTCPFIQVTLNGDPGSQAFYSVFITRGNDAFYYDNLAFRTYANDFTKTFYNDNYDRVVVAVGGLQDPADFAISMSCVTPSLQIVEPRQDLFAEVGDPDQPRRMMVIVDVNAGDASFVEGLSWEEFGVSVGGIPVVDVVTGAYIQGQYWLVVQPPTQTVSGDPPWPFDLDVTLEGLSDHEENAVHYRPLPNYDEVLVIDTSDSMAYPTEYPKVLAAKNAAKLYLDELALDDMMGAVEFENQAAPLWNGMSVVNDFTRALGKLIIDGVDTGSCTSIGGGLQEALEAYNDPNNPGNPDNPDAIVLLSDGMENTSPCWEYHEPWACAPEPYHDCSTGPYVHDQVLESGVPVNTVALGPGSHEELMERIAEETGGQYRFASLPAALAEQSVQDQPAVPGLAPPLGEPQAPTQDFEWTYRLAGIYDFFEGEVEQRERILVQEMTIADDRGGWYDTSAYIDQSVSQLTISIAYESWSVLNGNCTDYRHVQLVAPGGTLHAPTYSDYYHDVFEISSPEPGTWTVQVEMSYDICREANGMGSPLAPNLAPYHYQVIMSGQTGLATEVRVGSTHAERFIGLCVPIYTTFLGENGPISSGNLTAEVATPSGGMIPILLADDGNHGDGAAGDSIFGGQFCRDSSSGSYTIDILGRIETIYGTIRRLATATFYVQDDGDDDGDGLPNHWELAHGFNPGVADDTGNPDHDFGCFLGCSYWTNAAELSYGTDPNNDDTDGGGEMDFSEILWNQDPSGGPEDDQVEIPTSFSVTPGNGENVITYDARPGDSNYWLLWSTDVTLGDILDNLLDIGTTGIYTHSSLTNGNDYYYLLVAIRDGHISGFADLVSARPSLDPVPPQGNVLINNNAERAGSGDVTLTLFATQDAVEMLLSNTPEFTGATWEPFTGTRPWHIVPTAEGAAFVYARFRDAAGNVSGIAVDGILPPREIYLPVILR